MYDASTVAPDLSPERTPPSMTQRQPEHHSLDEIREHLYTAVLSDVLDQLGCTGQASWSDLRPLTDGMVVAGYARTARATPVNTVPAAPYRLLLSVLDDLTDQDVLVIAAGPMSQSSLFGGLLATAATASGARGVIADGHVRDAREIREIGLPTFARGFSPLDSCGRDEVVAIDEPVVVGGVPVCRGDLVLADADGMVAVPAALCDEVVARAMEKVRGEGDVRVALRAGMSVAEAFATFGIL
jgi:regulator of RNase E activity RraA